MVIEYPLSKGKTTLIDSEDVEKINFCSWSYDGRYAQSNIGNKKVYMHRIISGALPGQIVDHVNKD